MSETAVPPQEENGAVDTILHGVGRGLAAEDFNQAGPPYPSRVSNTNLDGVLWQCPLRRKEQQN